MLRQTSHSHAIMIEFFSRRDREFQDMGFPMSRQCYAHDRVGVPMLGAHNKKMRTTESSATHDRVRALGDSALGTCTTRHCASDKRTWARTIGSHMRPRHSIAIKNSPSRKTCPLAKKKKNELLI